jgi:hypothetical protein
MSILVTGSPFVSPSENKVDKDKLKLDDTRVYPEDTDVIHAYIEDVKDHIEKNFPEGTVGFKVRVDSMAVQMDNIMGLFIADSFKAINSCIFVWIFLTQHMQSCMLSSLGMGLILLSFPFTAFIVNYILQVKYFGFLQIMIVYIVLGIAADDIFVFYDAF